MPEFKEQDRQKLGQMSFEFELNELKRENYVTVNEANPSINALYDETHRDHSLAEKKYRDMFMVDTRTAEELRETFPELYEQAQAKRRKLKARANVSGAQKIKTDFWGSKKRKAQRRLEEIDRDKETLDEFRRTFDEQGRAFTNKSNELQRIIERRKAALEAELPTADEERAQRIRYALGKLEDYNTIFSPDTAYEKQGKLDASSDYAVTLHFAMEKITKSPVVIAKNGKRTILGANKLYRDMGRFACPLFKADEAESKIDEVWKITEHVYLLNSDTHLALEEPKEEEKDHETPREATIEEQAESFRVLLAHAEGIEQEYKDFVDLHPELYITRPTKEILLQNLEELNEVYKKTQVTCYVMSTMQNSKYFKLSKEESPLALSDETRKRFWELRVFLSAFEAHTHELSGQVTPWSQYYGKYAKTEKLKPDSKVPTLSQEIERIKKATRKEHGNVI